MTLPNTSLIGTFFDLMRARSFADLAVDNYRLSAKKAADSVGFPEVLSLSGLRISCSQRTIAEACYQQAERGWVVYLRRRGVDQHLARQRHLEIQPGARSSTGDDSYRDLQQLAQSERVERCRSGEVPRSRGRRGRSVTNSNTITFT